LTFAAIGLAMTAGFLVLLVVARPSALAFEDLARPIGSPIAAAFVATSILTRIKLKPSALSFAALGIFFLVSLGGFLGGFAAQATVVAVRALGGFAADVQAAVLFIFLIGFAALGLWAVTRLAVAFRLSAAVESPKIFIYGGSLAASPLGACPFGIGSDDRPSAGCPPREAGGGPPQGGPDRDPAGARP